MLKFLIVYSYLLSCITLHANVHCIQAERADRICIKDNLRKIAITGITEKLFYFNEVKID